MRASGENKKVIREEWKALVREYEYHLRITGPLCRHLSLLSHAGAWLIVDLLPGVKDAIAVLCQSELLVFQDQKWAVIISC